jgi:hypothetical protein
MRALGRAVRRDDTYLPPAALEQLVVERLVLRYATQG